MCMTCACKRWHPVWPVQIHLCSLCTTNEAKAEGLPSFGTRLAVCRGCAATITWPLNAIAISFRFARMHPRSLAKYSSITLRWIAHSIAANSMRNMCTCFWPIEQRFLTLLASYRIRVHHIYVDNIIRVWAVDECVTFTHDLECRRHSIPDFICFHFLLLDTGTNAVGPAPEVMLLRNQAPHFNFHSLCHVTLSPDVRLLALPQWTRRRHLFLFPVFCL